MAKPTQVEIDEAIKLARGMAVYAAEHKVPCAFEVAIIGGKKVTAQVFGTHTLFKSHKLIHVEPIPEAHRSKQPA